MSEAALEQEDNQAGLEQEEIDGLLKGGDSEGGLQALVQSSTISHERLPMLEIIFDRLVRLLSTSLRNFTSDTVDISIVDMTSMRIGDYLDNMVSPTLINVVNFRPWNTSALMYIENKLVYTMVDVLLGGRRDASEKSAETAYTTIERNLIEDFINVVLKDLSVSFEPVEPITLEFDRMETNTRFAMIERPTNAGIIVKMELEINERGGFFELFIPYSSIEPAREKLLQMFVGEKFGRDKIWENHLITELWNTSIQAEAILDKVTVNLADVMKWKKGSFLPLETYEGANVLIRSEDCELFTGKIGNVRKRVAVLVEENFLIKEDA